MKTSPNGPRGENGQAILLVILGLSIFLIGAVGLAIDGGQMYAQRQMTQAAADAAAEAGIMSVFAGTNVTSAFPFGTGSSPAPFICATGDGRTPCVYARRNGFGGSADDTVTVDFPATVAGVPLSSDPVPAIRVTIQRTMKTGLIRFIGPSTTSIQAMGVAGIVNESAQVPLLVTHPSLPSALTNGSAQLIVCGGPSISIQVNSGSPVAVSLSKVVDLSHAGPNDPGNCTTGTGADFGLTGGPTSQPGSLSLGTTGHYNQPSAPLQDPYADIPAPALPPLGTKSVISGGGCPSAPCTLYSPGRYSGGIRVKNDTALFMPGLYYIDGGGFINDANGKMLMAVGFPSDPKTGSGMVVYNTGVGIFDLGANSTATLVGADNTSFYRGILFFQDRAAIAQTHNLGGGGAITLTGTLYMTNWLSVMQSQPSQYQTLNLGGNAGIQINGSIVVGALNMAGTSYVTFNLAAGPILQARRAALVR
ncbi:MAG TPA: pilus assembly protein TadG-related protein [Bryobacteraceae bacterium]|nr:pilus assembly protein TadG-related protein [Bryobacteraceae bacterium]